MKTLLLIDFLFVGSAFSEGEESQTFDDSTNTGLFDLIWELSGSTVKIGLLDLAEHGGSAAASLLMPLVLFPLFGAVNTY